jgi:hypothetical protein
MIANRNYPQLNAMLTKILLYTPPMTHAPYVVRARGKPADP